MNFRNVLNEGNSKLVVNLKKGKTINFQSNGHNIKAVKNDDGDIEVNDGQEVYSVSDFINQYSKALNEGKEFDFQLLRDLYYELADARQNVPSIMAELQNLPEDIINKNNIDVKTEMKIFKDIAKLLDKSNLGKFL